MMPRSTKMVIDSFVHPETGRAYGIQIPGQTDPGSLHPDSYNWLLRGDVMSTRGPAKAQLSSGANVAAFPAGGWSSIELIWMEFAQCVVAFNRTDRKAWRGDFETSGYLHWTAFDAGAYPVVAGNPNPISGTTGMFSHINGELIGDTRWSGSLRDTIDGSAQTVTITEATVDGVTTKSADVTITGIDALTMTEPGMFLYIGAGANSYKIQRVIDADTLVLDRRPEEAAGAHSYMIRSFGLPLPGVGHQNRRWSWSEDRIYWSGQPAVNEGGIATINANAVARIGPENPGDITNAISYQDSLLILKARSVHLLTGRVDYQNNPLGAKVDLISADHGTSNTALTVGEGGVYWIDHMGNLIRWNGSALENLSTGVRLFDDDTQPASVSAVAGRVILQADVSSAIQYVDNWVWDEIYECWWRMKVPHNLPIRAGNVELAVYRGTPVGGTVGQAYYSDRSTEVEVVDAIYTTHEQTFDRKLILNAIDIEEKPGEVVRVHKILTNIRSRLSAVANDILINVGVRRDAVDGTNVISLGTGEQKVVGARISPAVQTRDYRRRDLCAMLWHTSDNNPSQTASSQVQLYAIGFEYASSAHRSNEIGSGIRK